MATIQIFTNKDGYTSQYNPSLDSNAYPNNQTLWISSPAYSNEQNCYIGFDISSLVGTTINSATLSVYIDSIGGWGYTKIFSRVTDNSWTESGLRWTNSPAWTAVNEASLPVPDGIYSYRTVDITAMLRDQIALGGNDFSVRGRTLNFYDDWIQWNSREQGYGAYLYVDYTPGCTTYNDVYIDKFGGNDTSCGATDLTPVQTFTKAYNDRLNSNGNIHILNISPAADFSAQSLTMTKGFSMDLNGGSGTFYWPVWL